MQHEGAHWGVGVGRTGNSYALPTKDTRIETLPIEDIKWYVDQFIKYASRHMNEYFKVSRIGCGLAGYKDLDIAPLFRDAPDNCYFDTKWKAWLEFGNQGSKQYKYWGTV